MSDFHVLGVLYVLVTPKSLMTDVLSAGPLQYSLWFSLILDYQMLRSTSFSGDPRFKSWPSQLLTYNGAECFYLLAWVLLTWVCNVSR